MIHLDHRSNAISTGSNAETGAVAGTVLFRDTGGVVLPAGPNADRPGVPSSGTLRFNTTSQRLEFWDGTAWLAVASTADAVDDLIDPANGNLIVDGVGVAGAGPADLRWLSVYNSDGGNVEIRSTSGVPGTAVTLRVRAQAAGTVEIGNTTSGTALNVTAGGAGGKVTISTTAVDPVISTTAGNLVIQPVGDVDFGTRRLTNVADPVLPTDAATKNYVDSVASGLVWKSPVRAATVSAADLAGYVYNPALDGGPLALPWSNVLAAPTIDGIVLANGERLLIKDAPDQRGNGIFTYDAVAQGFRRAADADNSGGNELVGGTAVFVREGAQHADTGWVLASPNGVAVLGTDSLVFVQFSDIAILPGDGLIAVGNTFHVSTSGVTTGIVADTVVVSSSGTAGEVLISTGVAGAEAAWGAVDLANASAVTGILPAVNGGTGIGNYAVGDMLYANGAASLAKLALGAPTVPGDTATILRVNAAGTAPEWAQISVAELSDADTTGVLDGHVLRWVAGTSQFEVGALDLSNVNSVTGVLPVANGGTGRNTLTAGAILFGDGANPVGELPLGPASSPSLVYALTSNDGVTPAFQTIGLDALSDVVIAAPADEDVIVWDAGAAAWVNVPAGNADRWVRVSATDTTSSWLDSKITAGVGLTKAIVVGGGGNEVLNLSVSVHPASMHTDIVTDTFGPGNGTAGQVLLSQGPGTFAAWTWLDRLSLSDGSTGFLATGPAASVNYVSVLASTATNPVQLSASGAAANIDLRLKAKGTGKIYLSGVGWPNTGAPLGTVLAANAANVLSTVTPAIGGGDQSLIWDDTLQVVTWAPLVVTESFKTIQMAGNFGGSPSVVADVFGDTLTLTGGTGIRLTADAATDTVTFALSSAGLVPTPVDLPDSVPFFDSSAGNAPAMRTFANIVADLDLVRATFASGITVKTADDTYAGRTITASTAVDELGIVVTNGNGVAGDPAIGLDIDGTPTGPDQLKSADKILGWDADTGTNRVYTGQQIADGVSLLLSVDSTAIFDGTSAAVSKTKVETDDNAGMVDLYVDNGVSAFGLARWSYGAGNGRLRTTNGTSGNDFVALQTGDFVGYGSASGGPVDLALAPGGTGAIVLGHTNADIVVTGPTGRAVTLRAANVSVAGAAPTFEVRGADNATDDGGIVRIRAGDGSLAGADVRILPGAGGASTDGRFVVADPTDVDLFTIETERRETLFMDANRFVVRELLAVTTTDATPTVLTRLDGTVPALGDNTAWGLGITVVARDTGGPGRSMYRVDALADRAVGAGTTAIINRSITILYEQNPLMDVDIAANTVTGAIEVTVTGLAGTTIKWFAEMRIVVLK